MNRLDEKRIIEIFQSKFYKHSTIIPEDVELIWIGDCYLVIKSDMLVESTDVPPGMKMEQIARKSIVSCVSDFTAKGVKPMYGIISLAIPRNVRENSIKKLAKGFFDSSKEFGFKIIGGDTNEGKEIVIQVSMFGFSNKIVRRTGAKTNDVIITSGPFGYVSSGLRIIQNNCKAQPKFSKKSKDLVFRPKPRLKFGLSISKLLSSSMDSSDGLSTTLNEMSRLSAKKFEITKLPCYKDILRFANSNDLELMDLIFNGGEEFEIVGTTSVRNLYKIKRIAKQQKIPLFEIGRVKKGKEVFFMDKDRIRKIPSQGWLHFKS